VLVYEARIRERRLQPPRDVVVQAPNNAQPDFMWTLAQGHQNRRVRNSITSRKMVLANWPWCSEPIPTELSQMTLLTLELLLTTLHTEIVTV
jgi:hypothetical protein